MTTDDPQTRISALVKEAIGIADAAKLGDLALHLDRVLVELGEAEMGDLRFSDDRDAA